MLPSMAATARQPSALATRPSPFACARDRRRLSQRSATTSGAASPATPRVGRAGSVAGSQPPRAVLDLRERCGYAPARLASRPLRRSGRQRDPVNRRNPPGRMVPRARRARAEGSSCAPSWRACAPCVTRCCAPGATSARRIRCSPRTRASRRSWTRAARWRACSPAWARRRRTW